MTGPDDDLPMTPELMQFILDEGVRMGHMKLHAPVADDTDDKVN